VSSVFAVVHHSGLPSVWQIQSQIPPSLLAIACKKYINIFYTVLVFLQVNFSVREK
jgi:hypothetical protein